MKKITPVKGGNLQQRQKLNEIINAVNKSLDIKGDQFVGVDSTPNGITIKLLLNQLLPRIPGVGGIGFRKAFAKDDAGSGNTIDAYLDTDGTGTEIEVTVEIAGGDDLNTAFPLLEDGTLFHVYDDDGTWRNAGNPFIAWGLCP